MWREDINFLSPNGSPGQGQKTTMNRGPEWRTLETYYEANTRMKANILFGTGSEWVETVSEHSSDIVPQPDQGAQISNTTCRLYHLISTMHNPSHI